MATISKHHHTFFPNQPFLQQALPADTSATPLWSERTGTSKLKENPGPKSLPETSKAADDYHREDPSVSARTTKNFNLFRFTLVQFSLTQIGLL